MKYSCFITVLFLSAQMNLWAQDARLSQQTDIPTLVKKLQDKNHEVAEDAADKLMKVGPPAKLPVTEMLKREKGCSERILAARVLGKIDPDNDVIVPALVGVLKDVCALSAQKDYTLRRSAAFELAETAAGIRKLAELLKDKKKFTRESAAFAFDERTENLIEASPSVLQAIEESLPALIEATKDTDEIVSGMSTEVLEQIEGGPSEKLRIKVRELLGKKR
jgi:HEAT repeat protein